MSKATMKRSESRDENNAAFVLSSHKGPSPIEEERVHLLGQGRVCGTDSRGHQMPQGRSPLEIVVDASEGYIPLWSEGTTLRWRFNEPSMEIFRDPAMAMAELRKQFSEALLAWGDAVPVRFHENDDLWDFEISMSAGDNCTASGCTLARAFFPDSGRHNLLLFPKMFEQSRQEQIETWIHELGHIFGLRHFFATVDEAAWPSEIFGTHSKFSIMNYGSLSMLTEADQQDLRRLYEQAWSGALTHINGTPIQFVLPYHRFAPNSVSAVSLNRHPNDFRSSGSYR